MVNIAFKLLYNNRTLLAYLLSKYSLKQYPSARKESLDAAEKKNKSKKVRYWKSEKIVLQFLTPQMEQFLGFMRLIKRRQKETSSPILGMVTRNRNSHLELPLG
ncbi:hypothetical protein CEXT_687981 [Caerostris extrusa]|uniref:Ribosomal protein S10 n=1 Tax=Caerostris extrusa TaxID=172846 RepID=A0AAV4S7N0_CAEEX|nr:hypothetical protein CEXT_687981 [Caerostris extrusa]